MCQNGMVSLSLIVNFAQKASLNFERRFSMYTTPKAELLYPETEVVLADVIGISQEQNDNDFNITDLLQ